MLTRLICDEADRIVTLVDRMEVFATTGRWRAVRSSIIRCSITSSGWRKSGFAATSVSSKTTIPRWPPVLAIRIS